MDVKMDWWKDGWNMMDGWIDDGWMTYGRYMDG